MERKALWADLETMRTASISWVLARNTSDHSLLAIQLGEDSFSFVKGVWKRQGLGHGLINLSFKLKRVKVALKEWNKSVFGKTGVIIKDLETCIDYLENCLQSSYNAEYDNDLLASKLEHLTWMGREETRLAHMAKKSWLKDGDQNSKFFHAYLNAKYHQRVQDMCLSNGTTLNTHLDIYQAAIDYFHQFLGYNSSRVLPNLSKLISPTISNEDNLAIGRAPTLEEIKDALFTIPIDSSPMPDDFGSSFFRVYWNFVKDDVFEAIVEFFHTHMLPKSYTTSYIVLIPKVDKHSGFDKFQPISFCSVVYKICSKIIVNRMTSLHSKIISKEQRAFIPGRSIFENINLTQKMVHSIHRKSIGGLHLFALVLSHDEWDFGDIQRALHMKLAWRLIKVADFLAKSGVEGLNSDWSGDQMLPSLFKRSYLHGYIGPSLFKGFVRLVLGCPVLNWF
ncbi:uncharacterized protein LOC122315388 [Carya illinoinensis]|uniref:uncharacterized protein LOC122315388 n=1 Tax=Carya illinoinensis TaxID=32201 RepID=UPI001C721079|nr:uncharacterized protein LOC122315388 [Carya illinoinensis]